MLSCSSHGRYCRILRCRAGDNSASQHLLSGLGSMGSHPLRLASTESLQRLMFQHSHPNDLSHKSVTNSKYRSFAICSVSERQKMRALNARWILMEVTTPARMARVHSKHRNTHGSHGGMGAAVAWLREVQVQYNKAIEDLDACFPLNISILLGCACSWRNHSYWIILANC